MTLLKYNYPETDLFNKRFSDIMDEFFNDAVTTRQRSFAPKMDISENEKNFVVEVEVPGMDKENIQINMENNVLTISGERKFEEKQEDKQYHRVETHYGTFTRSLTLPENADPENINAVYQNGILTVTIDKSEKSLKKQIEIK